MKKACILMLLSLALGCQSAALTEGTYTGQGLAAVGPTSPIPGVVISTHADGSQTIVSLPLPLGVEQLRVPAPFESPVVSVTVIPPTPGTPGSYTVTPEVKVGDTLVAARGLSISGEPPGTIIEKIALQKQRDIHNALPPVKIDEQGLDAGPGGGSSAEQAGLSWGQRAWVAIKNFFNSWIMLLLGIGLLIGACFLLPIIIPALAPIMAAVWKGVLTVLGWFWDIVVRIWHWFEKLSGKAPTPPPV